MKQVFNTKENSLNELQQSTSKKKRSTSAAPTLNARSSNLLAFNAKDKDQRLRIEEAMGGMNDLGITESTKMNSTQGRDTASSNQRVPLHGKDHKAIDS
mgnify:CR=1 FL=1